MVLKLSPKLLDVVEVTGSPFAQGEIRRGTIVELLDGDPEAALIEVVDDQGVPIAFVRKTMAEIHRISEGLASSQNEAVSKAQQFFENGFLFLQNRHYDRAKEQFRQSFSLEPKLRGVLLNITNDLAEKGAFESAIQVYTMLLEISPEYGPARENLAVSNMNRGIRLAQRGLFQQGMESFLKALAIASSSAIIYAVRNNIVATYTQLGLLYSKSNQFQLALQCFQRAFELEPSDTSRKNLAVAIIAVSTASFAGRATEARNEIFREPLLMGLPFSECLTAFGATLASLGEIEDAKQALHHAIRVDPSNKVALHNLEILSDQQSNQGLEVGFVPIAAPSRDLERAI